VEVELTGCSVRQEYQEHRKGKEQLSRGRRHFEIYNYIKTRGVVFKIVLNNAFLTCQVKFLKVHLYIILLTFAGNSFSLKKV